MTPHNSPPWLPKELQECGRLKFDILASGLKVSAAAEEVQLRSGKPLLRTRSGVSGGLDLVLPQGVHVNAPVAEWFAAMSPLLLDVENDRLVIRRGDVTACYVALQPQPVYYSKQGLDGVALSRVGQMCSGDRFCYGMTGPYCYFWKEDRRCQYCSIGLNARGDASQKTVQQLLDTLEQAIDDPLLPAKHVLIGGGTTDGDDMGAILASTLCKAIKSRFDISCYVMISAPLQNHYIDRLIDSGADELGMNIEFFSDDAWRRYIPGKHELIGRRRYLEALEYSVAHLGAIRTRSILIVGLEAAEASVEGAITLASMGVMPILSPFRPLRGTLLEHRRGFDSDTYWSVYCDVHEGASRYGIPTGPTCIACQNNVLALPIPGDVYHFY